VRKKEPHIVYLGSIGFPHGLAEVQRVKLISKALVEAGASVTVINRIGVHDPEGDLKFSKEGIHEGIRYVYASGTPYRPRSFFRRNLLKVIGLINEIRILLTLHNNNQLDSAILSTMKFCSALFYRFLSKILKFPIYFNYVELNSAISTRTSYGKRINDYLYEKYVFHLVEGVMPINDFLGDVVKRHSTNMPILKVPVLCDFERFKNVKQGGDKKYFLFCGGAGYLEIIEFILKAFDLLMDNQTVALYLVANGNPRQMSLLYNEIDKIKKKNLVQTFTNVTDAQIAELYVNAIGLLIPLRPTLQDEARFPHKIGEYSASGTPIITTNYGEVKKYFEDNVTALITREYDINEFSNKMQFIISCPEKAKAIGLNARSMGLENFDYRSYGKKLKAFVTRLEKT